MGKIANDVEYNIRCSADGTYLKLDNGNVVAGTTNPEGHEYVFRAIQPPDMNDDTNGAGYGLQPKDKEDYVNCQFITDPGGNTYWAAVADVSEPYVMMLSPTDEGVETTITNTTGDLCLTNGAAEGDVLIFAAAEGGTKRMEQKWVFVKKADNIAES